MGQKKETKLENFQRRVSKMPVQASGIFFFLFFLVFPGPPIRNCSIYDRNCNAAAGKDNFTQDTSKY